MTLNLTHLLFIFIFSITRVLGNNAMLCSMHPAFKPGLRPVLVSSWDYPTSTPSTEQLVYLPRYSGHTYAPVNNRLSSLYEGLDLFHTANIRNAPNIRIHFQRSAKVYMLVDVLRKKFDPDAKPSLPDWTSEGGAVLVKGLDKITYGVQEKTTRSMSEYAYVFSKFSGDKKYVDLPQTEFVRFKLASLDVTGSFNLLIAESDGNPSPPVGTFNGQVINPNTECPKSLHDAWKVPDDNDNDPYTRGLMFSSYHPQWDPCYWCAYNHEHGSNPGHLMGYKPKFTYTAHKNNQVGEEEDAGFKGFVIRSGENLIYYSIHVRQSSLRRVKTQMHTISIVIVNAQSKVLMAELQHKGDFGFAAVRLKDGKIFRPIFKSDRDIEAEQRRKNAPESFRSINILDVNNPNREEFRIRDPIRLGQYEVWQTLPICSKPKNRRALLNVQFKQPNTGFKSIAQPGRVTDLGRESRGKFFKSTGLSRLIKAQGLIIAQEYCPDNVSGTFYTDPSGTTLRNGPGKNNVKQFIRPGFKATLNGRFETTDRWSGLHMKGRRGFFVDHGYGIDADLN